MKRITQLILFLTLFSFPLLPACAEQPSITTPPNADHMVKFDGSGIAVLQGQLSGGSLDANSTGQPREVIWLNIPAKVEKIETSIRLALTVRPETELASSLASRTTAREYNIFHPNAGIYHAFPPGAQIEVTFRKKDAEFEAVSFQEIKEKSALFPKRVTVAGVFSTDLLSQGTVQGSFTQALNKNDGTIVWTLSVPIRVQGINAEVMLPVQSTQGTQVVTPNGMVPAGSSFSWESVQIQFTRKGDTLIANQIKATH
jgi:hypothetical protein